MLSNVFLVILFFGMVLLNVIGNQNIEKQLSLGLWLFWVQYCDENLIYTRGSETFSLSLLLSRGNDNSQSANQQTVYEPSTVSGSTRLDRKPLGTTTKGCLKWEYYAAIFTIGIQFQR